LYLELLNIVSDEIFTVSYFLLIIYLTMSSFTTIRAMLEQLDFSPSVATYLTSTCGINSLDEIAYLEGIDDVETTIKGVTNPEGTAKAGT
jgi:hypothetical protein